MSSDPSMPPAPKVSPEHAELQRQGAKAAARGESPEANPIFEPVNQPHTAGEGESDWSGRRDAWQRGHDTYPAAALGSSRSMDGSAENGNAHDEALLGVTRVLTFDGAVGLTSASGFFFERDGRRFLVTSRHVLFDAPARHAPDRIEIELHTDARNLTQVATLSILLHRDGLAVWRQARDSGGDVDVAVVELDLNAMPEGCVMRPFEPEHLPHGLGRFALGDRLVIPGFPLGFYDTVHHLPVARQASVASSYGVRFQGLGYFLTDARMHRGCSGSPVLSRVEAPAPGVPRWNLLGVHSSRMDMSSRDADQDESLGLNCAWYADVLMALTADTDLASHGPAASSGR